MLWVTKWASTAELLQRFEQREAAKIGRACCALWDLLSRIFVPAMAFIHVLEPEAPGESSGCLGPPACNGQPAGPL